MAHLENQVVLITGCSSGIGRALAEAFAASGHQVVATVASPPSVLKAGKNSVGLPLIGLLPTSVRDRILSKRFGLERL